MSLPNENNQSTDSNPIFQLGTRAFYSKTIQTPLILGFMHVKINMAVDEFRPFRPEFNFFI